VASLDRFAHRMRLRGRNVTENTDKLVRKVALITDQAVVSATPVDTGRAKSNWLVQVGSSPNTAIEPYVPGKFGSTAAENTQAAIDQASSAISGYTSGSAIYITNNLPYIQKLNNGSSAQASANFVQQAVLEGAAAVHTARILD